MRPLQRVTPTAEQLKIISRNKPGVEIIRGAAGSGKTTTAILRLKALVASFRSRRQRESSAEPVRVLILTYNRTLRGYVSALAEQEVASVSGVELEIETFARWAYGRLGISPDTIRDRECIGHLVALGAPLGLPTDFLCNEVDYVQSRFKPDDLARYLDTKREGRGTIPRMGKELRQRLLEEVIAPYELWKKNCGISDWNDLAIELGQRVHPPLYDVVIVDETQDISANQIRTVIAHLATPHSATFILDTVQRIYPRGFTWSEVGITVRPENSHRLSHNYRNTLEIARFVAPLVQGIELGDDDATIPDLSKCEKSGPVPVVLQGRFAKQMDYALVYLRKSVMDDESVVFLHPKGHGWFDEVKRRLAAAGLTYTDITKQRSWPAGPEQIALSTMASAKGLEFDHVLILGLNREVLPHGADEDDAARQQLRRLLAMSVARARQSVVLGYKVEERSPLFDLFAPGTYEEVTL